MSQNHIKRIAIVGARGQSGAYIAQALIKTGRFEVTALTRPDSSNTMPEGLNHIAKINYDDEASIVSALTNQDCLVITMSVFAGPAASKGLIEAAAKAGVPWVLPNEWGGDHHDPTVARESLVGEPLLKNRKLITDLGVSSYIAFSCSFWYQYSLAAGPWSYGFDFDNKKVTFFDKGDVKIDTTTWPKVGAGVAALLSLPIHRESNTDSAGAGACLDDFKNSCCYVSSFTLTQREMFESLLRVSGTKESDWTVEHEDVKERYVRGKKLLGEGQRTGFGICLYCRMFYPDAPGDSTSRGKNDNKTLGLEQEDLDTCTKGAWERWQKNGHMKM